MTKPTTKGEPDTPSVSPVLAEIELSRIESNPWQPRTTAPTDEELGDLLNSINAVGQKMPILVRAHPKKEKSYQLGDGAMRVLVQRKLKRKTITAVIQPLTDRQMKILAIAANTFVRLQDSDKESAVYKLWESEFKTDEEGRSGARKDSEYTGIRDMEGETGIGKNQIDRYLQSYEARRKITAEDPRNKELRASVEEISTKDMAAIASVAKESPKIAQEIVKARTAESAPLRSKDVQEIVKAVKEAAPNEKAKVAEQIIAETRAEAKAIQEVKKATAVRVEEIKADATSPEEKTKRAQKDQSDKDTKDREAQEKLLREAAMNQEKRDGQQLQDFINLETAAKNWAMRTEANANETIFSRIANVRNQNVKRETVAKARSIAAIQKVVAETWAAFAAKFKE